MRGREISVRETRVPGSTHHSSRRSSGRSGTGGSQCPSDVAYVHQQKRKRTRQKPRPLYDMASEQNRQGMIVAWAVAQAHHASPGSVAKSKTHPGVVRM